MNSNKLTSQDHQQIKEYLNHQMTADERYSFEEKMSKNPDLKKEVEKQAVKLSENKPDFISRTLDTLEKEIYEIPSRRYSFGKTLLTKRVVLYLFGIIIVAIILSLLFIYF